MCGYSGNKSKAEVVMDEIEARVDRYIVIRKDIRSGKTDYITKQYEITTLNVEIQHLLQSSYFPQGDYITPQMERITNKLKQI